MEPSGVTVQECIDMWRKKRMAAVIHNGKVVGFTGRAGNDGGPVRPFQACMPGTDAGEKTGRW